MKRKLLLITILSIFFLLAKTNSWAFDPIDMKDGSTVTPPDDATVGHVDDPTGHGEGDNIYQWTDDSGVDHWVCDNGNHVETPPPYEPQPYDEPPGFDLPTYEPPTYEPPPPYEPPNNPTATPAVCNKSCNTNAQCPQQCPMCAPSNSNKPDAKTCQVGPTATPTSSPTPTATPQPSATPTITPTPTPVFKDDMCKCDGIEVGNLGIGQESSITAFGKVTGEDIPYAKLPSITFLLYKTISGNNADIINQSQPIATEQIVNTAALARYKSVWKFTLDPKLDTKATYRIQAKLNCQKKIAAVPLAKAPGNRNVLAAETKDTGILSAIASFLFGSSQTTQQAPNPTPTPKTSFKEDQLKLGTFYPSQVLEKTCTFVKFSFE